MRVLHVTPYLAPEYGGPPLVVLKLIEGLQELGATCGLLSTNVAHVEPFHPASLKLSPATKLYLYDAAFNNDYAFSFAFLKDINGILKQYDVIHIHGIWHFLGLIVGKKARALGIPYLVMPHGMISPSALSSKRWKKLLYYRIIEQRHLRNASGLIYTNPEEERLATTIIGIKQTDYIVPLAVDAPTSEQQKSHSKKLFNQRFPSTEGKINILFMSRLHERKGVFLLLEAFQKVLASEPEARLLIAGTGQKKAVRRLHELCNKLEINGSVQFLGPVYGEQKNLLLSHCDIYVLPSIQESFGLALVEAMAFGLPVITTKNVNIYRDIDKSQAGIIIDLEISNISNMILKLYRDPQLCKIIGEQAKRFVSENFSWRKSSTILLNIFKDISK